MTEVIQHRQDGINLRFANSDDKEAIYAFALEAIAGADLPAFAEDAGENLQERIESGNPENVLIAEDTTEQDKIIGYIELDPDRTDKDDVMYIRGIFVLREYRRRGIGQNMLQIIREQTANNKKQLRVDAFTHQGLKFWENYGFKIHKYALYHDSS